MYWYQPAGLDWSLDEVVEASTPEASVHDDIGVLVAAVAADAQAGDDVVIMSNGSFGGIHQQLLDALQEQTA